MIAKSWTRKRWKRRPRRGQAQLILNLPEREGAARPLLLAAAGNAAIAALVLFGGGRHPARPAPPEERVEIREEEPPPPLREELKPLPKPVVRETRAEPEAPPEQAPPPPVLGLDAESMSEKGELAVATGNTLSYKSDSIVPPPAPIPLDQPPSMVKQVVPEYPAWAEGEGVTSKVVLLVVIDAQGSVTSAVVRVSGGQDFDENALAAAKSTIYRAPVRGGKSFPAQFLVTYNYVL